MNQTFRRTMIEATGVRAILLTRVFINLCALQHAKEMQSKPYERACRIAIRETAKQCRKQLNP